MESIVTKDHSCIVKIVQASRMALECTLVKSALITLASFPLGSCGDASLLVAYSLSSLGFKDFHIVYGEREDLDRNGDYITKTHAWLENNDFLIDITADQFVEQEYYIIKKKSLQ